MSATKVPAICVFEDALNVRHLVAIRQLYEFDGVTWCGEFGRRIGAAPDPTGGRALCAACVEAFESAHQKRVDTHICAHICS